MTNLNVHVVFNENARNTLIQSKVTEAENVKIFTLYDYQNIGPVCGLDSSKEVQHIRAEWLLKITVGTPDVQETQNSQLVQSDLKSIFAIIEFARLGSKIYLWTGLDTGEISSTARLIHYLPVHLPNLYKVDFLKIRDRDSTTTKSYPNVLGACLVSQVNDLFESVRSLEPTEYETFKQIGKSLLNSTSVLRVLQNEINLVDAPESNFDQILINNCQTDFQSAAYIIGHTLMDINFEVGDNFLAWRLRELVENKKLAYIGTLHHFRNYKVKKP